MKDPKGDEEIGVKNPAYESNEDSDATKAKGKMLKNTNGSYKKLFTYATGLDTLLIFVGSLAALAHGATFPAGIIVFSEITNKFIAYGKAKRQTGNTTVNFDINDDMARLASFYALVGVATLISAFLQTYCWTWTGARQVNRIRKSFFRAVVRQDADWFELNQPGEICNRLAEDLLIIQDGIGAKVGEVIQYVCRFLSGFIVAFVFSWELSLVVLAVLPALLITAAAKGKLLASWTVKEQEAYAISANIAQEVLAGIRTVVAFGAEIREGNRYCLSLIQAEKAAVKKGAGLGLGLGLFRFFIFTTYAIAFWYGAKMLSEGRLEGGDLLLVFFSLVIGASQIGQIGPYFDSMSKAKGAAAVVMEIIDTVPAIDVFSLDGKTNSIEGNIEFCDVSFSYPFREKAKVLNGLSFTVTKGKTIALVGESGCGKSTVTKLIQKCYNVNSGQIKIDGMPINDYNVRWLRQHIGVVTQEPVLFDTSVRENIRLGKVDATNEEIEQAAFEANAYDFVSSLPKGFDTLVGEGGAQLSGGQKQRIAIARALVRDPKILLLDEATSALDAQSEAAVQSALEKASKGRTTLIIAHRLSTVKKADQVLVMFDGEISECGTHDELMAIKGRYYDSVILRKYEDDTQESELFLGGCSMEVTANTDGDSEIKMRSMSHIVSNSDSLAIGNTEQKKTAKNLEFSLKKRTSSRKSGHGKINTSNDSNREDDRDELASLQPIGFSRLMRLNKTEWPYIVLGCLANVILGAVPIAMSLFVSGILKSFSFLDKEEIRSETEKLALMLTGFALLAGFSAFCANFFLTKSGEILTTRMRGLAFRALLRQEIAYFDDQEHSTFNLNTRLALDASRIKGITGQRLGVAIEVTTTLLSGLTLAFVSGWQLTLLMLAFIPLIILSGMFRGRRMMSSLAKDKEKLQSVNSFASEIIMNMRTVNSLGKEAYFVDKFVELTLPMYNSNKKDKISAAFFAGVANSVMMFASAATFRLGGYLVSTGDMEFHEIFRVYIAIGFAAMFSGMAVSMAPDFLKAKVSAARIFELLDRKPLIDSTGETGCKMERLEGHISIDKGRFSYLSRPDVSVLTDFSLTVKAGMTYALVGESGSGKSTTISLIERFYDLASGSVRVDDRDIRDLNLPWLRSQIGIVSQEPILFSGTIRDNILYGLSEEKAKLITQHEIEAVAMVANIHHVINSFPQGYDTEVGGSTSRMSGGEKQRIAIARALIRNPRILLLDEATSALDTGSEKAVQEALDKAMIGRTSIIVAHRLSTIQNADRIVVIEDGMIVEQGSHGELIEQKGAYYALNRTQVES